MAQLRVKINPEKPSLETVRAYRDFSGLMSRFQKYYTTNGIRYMLYHDRKKLIYIVLIIIFLLLLLFSDDVHAASIFAHPIELVSDTSSLFSG